MEQKKGARTVLLKSIKESVINMVTSRVFVLIIVFTCLSGILIYRLFSLQIVHGEEYLDGFKLKIRKERTIASTRGNIYDRNGKLLAYNELAYAVTVQDTGCGIAPEDQAAVFDRYFHTTANTKHDSTGLGLTIAQELAHLHHGEITLQSEVGKGSRFTLKLPILE